MLAVVDARAPKSGLRKLEQEFDVVPFLTKGLTYEEVAGHPDIFLFQSGETIVYARNTPDYVCVALSQSGASLVQSVEMSGHALHDSTRFNCCATESYWFHKAGYAASEIVPLLETKIFVPLPQAYARCSMSAISDHCILTSDAGVGKALASNGIEAMFVDPFEIVLPGFKYGFFGGTNGWVDGKIYFLGNILKHAWGVAVDAYLSRHGIEVVCLCDGFLYDGGGIFFVE